MIASLNGRLSEKDARRPQRLVLDVHGVGYEVWAPLFTVYTIGDPGATVSLRIHTHVREDALQLFGFATELELLLFERLIGVSGVGPRLALAVLSGLDPQALVRAIRGGDLGRLTAIPGVGRKTAERLVVELKDRLPQDEPGAPAPSPEDTMRDDLLSALANLGYQRVAAEKSVDAVLGQRAGDGFEACLRETLKALAR